MQGLIVPMGVAVLVLVLDKLRVKMDNGSPIGLRMTTLVSNNVWTTSSKVIRFSSLLIGGVVETGSDELVLGLHGLVFLTPLSKPGNLSNIST